MVLCTLLSRQLFRYLPISFDQPRGKLLNGHRAPGGATRTIFEVGERRMKLLYRFVFQITLPLIVVWALILISPKQLGYELAQGTRGDRLITTGFVVLFLWGLGGYAASGWEKQKSFWVKLSFPPLNRNLGIFVGLLVGIITTIFASYSASWIVTEYLPYWKSMRVVIVTVIGITVGWGMMGYCLAIRENGPFTPKK